MSRTRFIAMSAAFAVVFAGRVAMADIIISEAAPWASSNSPYMADWFELTNTGGSAVDITGWKMDDNSAAFATARDMRGVTSIAPGQSVVFIESGTDPLFDSAFESDFIASWFGGSAPSGFALGFYGGSGVGLSSSGDGVTIFDAGGSQVAAITFGASPGAAPWTTFDNAAGAAGEVTLFSAAGTNGAFNSVTGDQVGSPGTIGVPEPAALALAGLALATVVAARRVVA